MQEPNKRLHQKCERRLQSKCRWEHMSRPAVCLDWPSIVCRPCRREVLDGKFYATKEKLREAARK